MEKLRGIHEILSEEEISKFLNETYPDMNQPIEFEPFLKVQWGSFWNINWWFSVSIHLANKFFYKYIFKILLGILKSSSKGDQQKWRQKEIEGFCVIFEIFHHYSLACH